MMTLHLAGSMRMHVSDKCAKNFCFRVEELAFFDAKTAINSVSELFQHLFDMCNVLHPFVSNWCVILKGYDIEGAK